MNSLVWNVIRLLAPFPHDGPGERERVSLAWAAVGEWGEETDDISDYVPGSCCTVPCDQQRKEWGPCSQHLGHPLLAYHLAGDFQKHGSQQGCGSPSQWMSVFWWSDVMCWTSCLKSQLSTTTLNPFLGSTTASSMTAIAGGGTAFSATGLTVAACIMTDSIWLLAASSGASRPPIDCKSSEWASFSSFPFIISTPFCFSFAKVLSNATPYRSITFKKLVLEAVSRMAFSRDSNAWNKQGDIHHIVYTL